MMEVDYWDRTDRMNLSYCVSEAAFGARYNSVVQGMYQAAAAWENTINVRFVHKVDLDPNCTVNTTEVLFDVQASQTVEAGRGFVPGTPREDRQLLLSTNVAWDTQTRYLNSVLLHEVGHILGFGHDGGQADSYSECSLYSAQDWDTSLTPPDPYSVMMPPNCGGALPNEVRFISQLDAEGAQSVYGAPTNIISTQYGYFQRKQTTGELYRNVPQTNPWVYVGPAAQAYAAVDDQVYALTASGGAILQYVGPGDNWQELPSMPSPARQIFECAELLCASGRTKNESESKLFRFDGSSWSHLGSLGSRFTSTGATRNRSARDRSPGVALGCYSVGSWAFSVTGV